MRRATLKTAFFCGLALSFSSVGPFENTINASELDPPEKKEGGGDVNKESDKHKADRGGGRDKPQAGGDRSQRDKNNDSDKSRVDRNEKPPTVDADRSLPTQRGNAPSSTRRGGMHAPSAVVPPPAASGGGQRSPVNRTPSFSRPNFGNNPGRNVRPDTGIRIGDIPRNGNPGTMRSGNQVMQNNRGVRSDGRRPNNYPSRISNQPFLGNTVAFNNRQFNLGSSNYQPAYYRHSGYHGYWNGNRGYIGGSRFGSGIGFRIASRLGYGLGSNSGFGGGYSPGWGWGLGNGNGYQGYGYRPIGWGLGGWGLGSLIYNSGYLGYSNPYYVITSSTGYNYSQPIQVSYNPTLAVSQSDPNSGDEMFNSAVAAFQQYDYDSALDITNKGIDQYPDDAVLHEFRSLVLFARKDYQQSAATIHTVLAIGPGWDWTTLSSMYASVDVYTQQLRMLEAFTKANPQDAAGQFLLAYHYMSCGHPDAGVGPLQQVVKLMPNDRVALDMLRMVSTPKENVAGELTQSPAPSREPARVEVKPISPATLIGTWKAGRADGSAFSLTLTKDANFTWNFAQKDQKAQEFDGTYSLEGNVLALERKDGGSLIAELTPSDDAKFNFKLLGAPEDDPGLDFGK